MPVAAPITIVASCTERKRASIPRELHLRTIEGATPLERAATWYERLFGDSGFARHPARDLYGGEHWALAQRTVDSLVAAGRAATLWVASAGYGLMPASAAVHAYSATFAQGGPDSVFRGAGDGVSRIAQLQVWWNYLSDRPGPEAAAARSLRALMQASPDGEVMVVASPDYVRAMRQDLLAGRDGLESADLLTIVSNHDLSSDEDLAHHLIPVDHRSKTLLGGSMLGLNARVALSLIEWSCGGALSAPHLRERYQRMVSDAEKPPKLNREKKDDKDVLAFLRAELANNPRAGWTLLLRAWRGGGRACEQGRFRELHQQVREELAPAQQEGLKLDQD